MNRISSITLLFMPLLAAGCGQTGKSGGTLPAIDIVGNLGTYRPIPMSDFISEVEYVPLETGPGFLISRTNTIVTDTRIFIGDYDHCYAFTRDGKFISDVGRVGRGPGEWRHFFDMSVDEENGTVYLESSETILEYTRDGKFLREIDMPVLHKREHLSSRASNVSFLRDNFFVGHIDNDTGHEPHNWIIFDDTGTIVKSFDNYIKIEKEQTSSSVYDASKPFVTSGTAYVNEFINDTLYSLNLHDGLVPKFVFSLGRYVFRYDGFITDDTYDRMAKSIMVNSRIPMTVTDDDIFFSFQIGLHILDDFGVPEGVSRPYTTQGYSYTYNDKDYVFGLYNIPEGRTDLLDRDPVSHMYGLINDIDGGLSFWPQYYNTSTGELVQAFNAHEIKDFLTEEYFAAHPSRDPAAHERLRKLVKNLKETDNPVVVIAKLKK